MEEEWVGYSPSLLPSSLSASSWAPPLHPFMAGRGTKGLPPPSEAPAVPLSHPPPDELPTLLYNSVVEPSRWHSVSSWGRHLSSSHSGPQVGWIRTELPCGGGHSLLTQNCALSQHKL